MKIDENHPDENEIDFFFGCPAGRVNVGDNTLRVSPVLLRKATVLTIIPS